MNDDDLFDNGIDGEPFEGPNDDYADEESYWGGTVLYANSKDETRITYFCGQWNDSGVDPDSISLKCNYMTLKDDEYYVSIGKDSIWIKVAGKTAFELKGQFNISDFVEVDSPIDINVRNRFNFDEMIDSISEKKIKFVFDKEKFKAKLERYRGLLVFS